MIPWRPWRSVCQYWVRWTNDLIQYQAAHKQVPQNCLGRRNRTQAFSRKVAELRNPKSCIKTLMSLICIFLGGGRCLKQNLGCSFGQEFFCLLPRDDRLNLGPFACKAAALSQKHSLSHNCIYSLECEDALREHAEVSCISFMQLLLLLLGYLYISD